MSAPPPEKGTDAGEQKDRAEGAIARCPVTGHTAALGSAPVPGHVLPKNDWGKKRVASPSSSSSLPSSSTKKASPGLNVGGEYGAKSDFHDQGGAAKRPGRGGFPVMYHSYLQLDKICGAQTLMSARRHGPNGEIESAGFGPDGKGAHDEHLFIIIHQTYELWFKQVLFELDDVVDIFSRDEVPESNVGVAVRRLKRVTEIQRVLLDQLTVLETMTPLGFLEFRDYLFPASGFQSLQFRKIEQTLGLPARKRLKYAGRSYCSYLPQEHVDQLNQITEDRTIFRLVEKWLERTPFLEWETGQDEAELDTSVGGGDQKDKTADSTIPSSPSVVSASSSPPGSGKRSEKFEFWTAYESAVEAMCARDIEEILHNSNNYSQEEVSDEETKAQLAEVEKTRQHYAALFNPKVHAAAVERGDRRLSYRALQASLLIMLYQDEPILQLPAMLIKLLIDVDELMTLWRHRHALMVHRMIGRKLGTGGSSGFSYLKATAERHKVFQDLFNLSTYMIPGMKLPPLPASLKQSLDFQLREHSKSP